MCETNYGPCPAVVWPVLCNVPALDQQGEKIGYSLTRVIATYAEKSRVCPLQRDECLVPSWQRCQWSHRASSSLKPARFSMLKGVLLHPNRYGAVCEILVDSPTALA